MRTGSIGGINFAIPNERVWSAERQLITLERVSGSVTEVTLTRRPGVDVATYKLDENGKCTIDITDLVRAYGVYQNTLDTSTALYIGLRTSEGRADSFYIYMAGFIDPEKVCHPPLDMPFCEILPPERILWNESNFAGSVISECYITGFFSYFTVDGASWVDSSTKRQVQASGDFTISWQNVSRKSTFYGRVLNECEEATAAVRWVSFAGVQRKHYFKVRKPTITPDGSYQLLTMDNSYNEVKGRVDSVTLVIDELSAYDLWYYSDIITSSKVEVFISGAVGWSQVQVTNKNVTIPDGDARNGKLEITINWRRYDAVTM